MELSKENQEWFNQSAEVNPDAGVPIFYEDVVEEKLLELQTQIETLQRQLKQAEIDAIEKMAESLITGAVANHWCEKEQAGYFWCHDGITNYLNKLKEQD